MADTVRIRLGNSLDNTNTGKGNFRMLRMGDKYLSSYKYKTVNLAALDTSYAASKEVEVVEVDRFFSRTTDPRMSTGMRFFAPMDAADTKCYTRQAVDTMTYSLPDPRNYGQNTDKDESVGLVFKLYHAAQALTGKTVAYFDNALVKISSILWEFNVNGGRGKWYQLYDLPNRTNTRITLPKPSDKIRVRALSNNTDEWVQAFAVTPHVDYQNSLPSTFTWTAGLAVDGFGYLTWAAAENGKGSPIYHVFKGTAEIGATRDCFYQLSGYSSADKYHVTAVDAKGQTLTSAEVRGR